MKNLLMAFLLVAVAAWMTPSDTCAQEPSVVIEEKPPCPIKLNIPESISRFRDTTARLSFPCSATNTSAQKQAAYVLITFQQVERWSQLTVLPPSLSAQLTATLDMKDFPRPSRPMKMMAKWVIQQTSQSTEGALPLVLSPIWNATQPIVHPIRGQHRLDSRGTASNQLGEVTWKRGSHALFCTVHTEDVSQNAYWEIFAVPMPASAFPKQVGRYFLKRNPQAQEAYSLTVGEGKVAPQLSGNSVDEAGRASATLAFPFDSNMLGIGVQIILWSPDEQGAWHAYSPFVSTLQNARNPAYAPEFAVVETPFSHRIWLQTQ